MRSPLKLPLCAALAFASLFLAAAPATAWEDHAFLTREALMDVEWLDAVPPLRVTTRTLSVDGVDDLYQYPSRAETPGETISARIVLERYADEPDRGPDRLPRVSWLEDFLAEYRGLRSQRHRHTHYPVWTTHFPLQAMEMGAAPDRAAAWYAASKTAFDREDPYWGFRFLAGAMHYVQDCAQPFHVSQSSTAFMFQGLGPGPVARVMANYHFTYQTWVARRLLDSSFKLGEALNGFKYDDFGTPEGAAAQVAEEARIHCQPVFDGCVALFDPRHSKALWNRTTVLDAAQLEPEPAAADLAKATRQALGLTGRATRGMLQMVRPLIRERFLEGLGPDQHPWREPAGDGRNPRGR